MCVSMKGRLSDIMERRVRGECDGREGEDGCDGRVRVGVMEI